MSYTRHTWVDDESVTYEKLNNIEDGIEEAAQSGGGGGVDAIIWLPNSTEGYQVLGDFNAALAKVQQGIPLVAFKFDYGSSGGYFQAFMQQGLATYYDTSAPNQIDLLITGGVGFRWTANGVTYFD